MRQTPKDEYIIQRVRELLSEKNRRGESYNKWDLYQQAKEEYVAEQRQAAPVDREEDAIMTRLATVDNEYWSLVRETRRMKAKIETALLYLDSCNFSSVNAEQAELNQKSVQKAKEQLHGVIDRD